MKDRYDENGNDKPSSLTRCFTEIVDTTLFLERSEVRSMIIQQFQQTGAPVLRAIDALPIFSAEDIRGAAQAEPNPTLWGQIAAVYGSLDAEDCKMVDREWAKQRGYILPTDGTSALAYAETIRGALLGLLSNAYNEGFGEGMREHTSSKGGWPWNSRKQKYGALLDKALSIPSTSRECGLCGGPLPCLTHSQGLPLSSTNHQDAAK